MEILENFSVLNIFHQHTPIITKWIRGKPCPWLNEEIKSEMNKRDQLYRKWIKSKKPSAKQKYRDKKNLVNTMIRSAKSYYSRELLRESANDCYKFWKSIKKIYPCSSNKAPNLPSFIVDGYLTDDKDKIVNGSVHFSQTSSTPWNCNLSNLQTLLGEIILVLPRTRRSFNFEYVPKIQI